MGAAAGGILLMKHRGARGRSAFLSCLFSGLFSGLIVVYQRILSPFLHALTHTLLPFAGCRFQPTCSVYARAALRRFPLHVACLLIGKRVFCCHPFSSGGADPLP